MIEIQTDNFVRILGYKISSNGGKLQCGSNYKLQIILEKYKSELKSSLKENLNYNEPYYIHMFSEIIMALYQLQLNDIHLPDISIDNLVLSNSNTTTNNNRQNISTTNKKVILIYDLYSDPNR